MNPDRRRFLSGLAASAGIPAMLSLSGCGRHLANRAAATTSVPIPPPTTSLPTTSRPATTTTTAPSVDPAAVQARWTGTTPTQWGTDVSGVDTRVADAGTPEAPTLALTFDACGGPGSDGVDTALVDLLEREHLPATFFLNARWVLANGATLQRIAANPDWEIANHGTAHRPLSVTGRSAYGIAGTRSAAEAVEEVWTNHELLRRLTGRNPVWFRSGTAHYDDVATRIVADLGEQPVGFTVNGDAGATFTAAQVDAALTSPLPAPAAVAIMHMIHPGSGTAAGLAGALPALRARGTRFVTLTGGAGTVPGPAG